MDRDFYPVENVLLSLVKPGPNAVLFVDVGGGFSHDLQEIPPKASVRTDRARYSQCNSTVSYRTGKSPVSWPTTFY